jgi:hypothetical protein
LTLWEADIIRQVKSVADFVRAPDAFSAAKEIFYESMTPLSLEKTFGRQQAGSLLGKFFQVYVRKA